jgi:PIN domain nuclease of toxin-antitoxin system
VAAVTYLDTHVVAWLYSGQLDLFPAPVRQMLAGEELLVSPMVVLELQYLFEIGRTTEPAETVVSYLQGRIGLQVCDKPFTKVIMAALEHDWTRDPFDRIIVAQAALDDSRLLSKDGVIRARYPRAFWQ